MDVIQLKQKLFTDACIYLFAALFHYKAGHNEYYYLSITESTFAYYSQIFYKFCLSLTVVKAIAITLISPK